LYEKNAYSPHQIWNCDESGAQAGKDGGGYVLAKKGARSVHVVVPDQREWLSVLACVNAAGEKLPNFFIFKGTKKKFNYISKTSDKHDAMAM